MSIKGFKTYKKVQQVKAKAKRAAAAVKNNFKKCHVSMDPKMALVSKIKQGEKVIAKIIVEAANPPTSTKEVVRIDEFSIDRNLLDIPEFVSPIIMSTSKEVSDIHAQRKALEAALYENMETPKERSARLDRFHNVDAEFHSRKHIFHNDGRARDVILEDSTIAIVPIMKQTQDDIHIKDTWTAKSSPDDFCNSLSPIDSGVSSTPANSDSSSNATSVVDGLKTLDVTKKQSTSVSETHVDNKLLQSQTSAITIDTLFASTKGFPVIHLPSAVAMKPRTARTLESVEKDIFDIQQEQGPKTITQLDTAVSKIDPAIVSSKLKKIGIDVDDADMIAARDPAVLSYKIKPVPSTVKHMNTSIKQLASATELQEQSSKLMALLGVGVEKTATPTNLDEPSMKLKSLLGIGIYKPAPFVDLEALTTKLKAFIGVGLPSPDVASSHAPSLISSSENTRSTSPRSGYEYEHSVGTPRTTLSSSPVPEEWMKYPDHLNCASCLGIQVPIFQDLTHAQHYYGPAFHTDLYDPSYMPYGNQFDQPWSA